MRESFDPRREHAVRFEAVPRGPPRVCLAGLVAGRLPVNRPADPPPPFSPPPPDEGGPSFEVVWRVEDDDPATRELPARFQFVRDLGDGPVGPLFAVRDAQRTERLARLEVVSRSRTLSPAERDALQARLAAVARIGAPTLAPTLEIGRLPDGRVSRCASTSTAKRSRRGWRARARCTPHTHSK